MGNIPCDLIKDLLPLYTDDVCSEQTKHTVEEHLATCERCREIYEDMQEKLPGEKAAENLRLFDENYITSDMVKQEVKENE